MSFNIGAGWSFGGGWVGTAGGGTPPAPSDSYFNYVSLLLNGDAINGATSTYISDASTNNFVVTPNNTSNTSINPFQAGYYSNYFNGSNQYLSAGTNTSFILTGDFTIEAWVYKTSSSNCAVAAYWTSGSVSQCSWAAQINPSGHLVFYFNNTLIVTGSSQAVSLNTWTHCAWVRQGSTVTLYVNGIADTATGTASGTSYTPAAPLYIGCQNTADGLYFPGYMSNFRIVQGTAVYTTNFTPSTQPLTAISGTSLLLNDVNAGIPDLSQNNVLQTVGSAQVSTSVKKYGTGSLAFDGTGDYLFREYSPNFNFGTGSFTIEMWVYPLSVTSTIRGLFAVSGGSGGNPKFVVHLNSGTPDVHYNNLTNGSNIYTAATSSISANTWTHIAFVRNGSTWYWFINGVQSGTGSNSTNITFTSQPSYVGYGGEGYFDTFNGYIDDLRITNGYARYTANFTPPTQALPTY